MHDSPLTRARRTSDGVADARGNGSRIGAAEPRNKRGRSTRIGDAERRHRPYYAMVLPAVLLLFCVNTFPLLYSLYVGTTNYSLSSPDSYDFVGVENFH